LRIPSCVVIALDVGTIVPPSALAVGLLMPADVVLALVRLTKVLAQIRLRCIEETHTQSQAY
jgi:hypothetical protein